MVEAILDSALGWLKVRLLEGVVWLISWIISFAYSYFPFIILFLIVWGLLSTLRNKRVF